MKWKRRLGQQGLALVLIRYDDIEGSVVKTKAWLTQLEAQMGGGTLTDISTINYWVRIGLRTGKFGTGRFHWTQRDKDR